MQATTQSIEVSDKKITYYDLGNPNAPAILMGHSFLWDKNMWREQFDALGSQYRLIVPDLWAHGESDVLPKTPTSIQQIAADNWTFMQNLNIDRFAIIGLSVGGMWATQMALDHPNNVTALTIMGTFVGAEPAATQEAYMALMNQFKKDEGFSDELIETTWPFFYSSKLPETSSLINEMKHRLKQIPKNRVKDIYEIGKAIFTRHSNLEKLSHLNMPFAIVTGEDDIARVPAESEKMARAAGCDNLYRIKNAGHISCLEQPKDVSTCLLEFLDTALGRLS